MLSVAIIVVSLPCLTVKAAEIYENTYQNTGNQRADLVGVAMTQVGYREGRRNDTKYGSWYGAPEEPWCATFITWCAAQADISTDILQRSAWANPSESRGFNIPCYSGKEYTPLPGDIIFIENFDHVGIVYGVRGDIALTIEGNTNDNGSNEGYAVMMLERPISECDFGVPNYEGCDKEHTYIRGCDVTHPHKNYYQCTTCGDKYYTGSNGFSANCDDCVSCGCDASDHGYYRVKDRSTRLSLYRSHSTANYTLGLLSGGESVYVHAHGKTWGHVFYGNQLRYIQMSQIERYVPAPNSVTANAGSYYKGDNALISWESVLSATSYTINVLKNGEAIQTKEVTGTSFTVSSLLPGDYEVRVLSHDNTLVSETYVSCTFSVLDTYVVSYDAAGGSHAPSAQRKLSDKPLTLTADIPVREGFEFLGWGLDPAKPLAVYQPGDVWVQNNNTTLYAVWRGAEAAPSSLSIYNKPEVDTYVLQQELNTHGLMLLLSYNDGSAILTDEGYTVDGFSSEEVGISTVRISLEGLCATYDVNIIAYYPGDIDGNTVVDKEDVMQLLWHVSFPEMYPISISADFNHDDLTDKEDVMHLLWHVSFPEMYPMT